MIRPNRFLSVATLAAFVVAITLSSLYHYRAINDLQQARLQTDQAISSHLPDAVFSLIQQQNNQAALPTSRRQPLKAQGLLLELQANGLNIIALELLSLQQVPLLSLGERPVGEPFTDPVGFNSARQGEPASRLVSPAWFNREDDVTDGRHIQLSQIALNMPGDNKVSAVVAIYSDQSEPVQAIYLTQAMMLVLTFVILSGLNLYLHGGLKRGKKQIDDQLAENSKASHQAGHDALTGLPNRTILSERLKQATAQGRRHQHSVVVMFLDLDGFKAVNDTLGHHTGDQLLKVVARRLNECMREGDTVSRLGGDEFVLVLPMFDSRYSEQVSEVAQRILDSLSMPMNLQGREIQLGCSIGVSCSPDDGKDADTLLKNADTAMYQAKEQGRNNVQFYSLKPVGGQPAPSNLRSDLQRALQRQEFRLLFQPQQELHNETITGVAVFLYWLHPTIGMTRADKLLPTEIKNSATLPVGIWMLKHACIQRMAWQQQKINCGPLTIYLSEHLFQFETLASTVRDILKSTRLPPQHLELELTGCLLRQNLENALPVLSRLKSLGVGLSIDGTEFSPNIIRQLPLDTLRVGRRTTGKMLTSGVDSIIARALIGLGRQLSHLVIAEGVETLKQKEYLRAKGCDRIQGACISSPLQSGEITKLLQNYASKDAVPAIAPIPAKRNAGTGRIAPS